MRVRANDSKIMKTRRLLRNQIVHKTNWGSSQVSPLCSIFTSRTIYHIANL